MTTIRPATADDAVAAADVYASGALDEAVFSWVIPDEQARRAHAEATRDVTAAWLTAAMSAGEVVLALSDDGAVVGVSVWERLDGAPPRAASPETTAFLEQTYGEYAPRMATVMAAVVERHPHDEPHWYLQQVVVDAVHRGKGIGGALLRDHLARVDADGLPAYLEASSPRNQALYERLGFHPAGDVVVLPDDGPRLQPMWRPAR